MSAARCVQMRPWLLAIIIAAMLSMPVAAYLVGSRVSDNCQATHTLYTALDRILTDNDRRIDRMADTLTPQQMKDSHAFNHHARVILRDGDCG